MRFHRALATRAKKINPNDIADWGEDYLKGFKVYKNLVTGVPGLMTEKQIKNKIAQIDKLENEIYKMEDKMLALNEKRQLLAAELEDDLNHNLDVLAQYLLPEEIKDLS
jgi:wobble nucleotide-excising tRNase